MALLLRNNEYIRLNKKRVVLSKKDSFHSFYFTCLTISTVGSESCSGCKYDDMDFDFCMSLISPTMCIYKR